MILLIDMQHIYYRCWYTRDKYDAIISSKGRNVAHVKAAYEECVKIINDFEFHYDEQEAAVCICLDRETRKKEMFPEYKANRQGRLDADNYAEIEYIANTLAKHGATIYARQGFEADDIIYSIVKSNPNEDIVIYTSDADLLMHVNEHTDVWIRRHNEYLRVKAKRFAHQVSFISKREALYNDVVLYKSCVGDPSDNIKGVKNFGDMAYKKKVKALIELNPDIIVPTDKSGVLTFAKQNMKLTEEQLEQFIHSLEMVYPFMCDDLEIPAIVPLAPFLKSRK